MKLKTLFEEIIDEWQAEHGFKQLIPYIEDKLKIKVGPLIHSGTMSDVFDLGDKVLKITSTPDDAAGLYIGTVRPDYPIPKVYALYKIQKKVSSPVASSDTDKSWLSKGDLWVAIVEKVKIVRGTDKQIYDLEKWFRENTNLVPNDIHSENIGRDSKGQLVYLDPNFENTISLAKRVPTLK